MPSIRERLHAMSERIWNPDAGRDWEDFAARAKGADARLDRVLGIVTVKARMFGRDGKPVGDVTSRAFHMHGEPEKARF